MTPSGARHRRFGERRIRRVRRVPLMRNGMAAPMVALMGAACAGNRASDQGSPAPTAENVREIEKDFSISLSPTSGSSGEVTFDIRNDGPSMHELVVIRTDLPEAELPTSKGVVDEGADGVEIVKEKEDIAANASASLTVDLEAGAYVLICNLPAHYQSGMHATFSVS
jgi:uncharacterized cupredoxin-like copper-binding protein